MTAILSLFMMVFSLWATVITVESLNSWLINFWIVSSVFTSMLAVASSIKMTLFFLRAALQIQIKAFSPALRFSPFSVILKLTPLPSLVKRSPRLALLSMSLISLSEHLFSGSRLNFKVFLNRTGSCGIMVILSLRSANPTLEMSTPSISIDPLSASMILQRAKHKVLLPAPVLPTIPTFSPALMLRLIFLRTTSVSSRYLREKSLNSTRPLLIHCSPFSSFGTGSL
mmetsp:Transcript_37012/g.36614  ORF Transcript_37012/g.36614 Transcript_37012/m.36614 type:complete len:227 (-) Transcript_37012:3136-3816(-)